MSSERRGFRRRNAAVAASRHFGPNMTPMVDIVMVILIFFMAGSAFMGPEWFLNVAVKERGTQPEQEPPDEPPEDEGLSLGPTRMTLEILRDGDRTIVNGLGLTGASIDALGERLRVMRETGASPSVELAIIPAADTPYQDVIRVYDLCVEAEPASVGLVRAGGR